MTTLTSALRNKQVIVCVPLETTTSSSVVEVGDIIVSICQDPNKTKLKSRVTRQSTGAVCWIREPRRVIAIVKDDSHVKRAVSVGVISGRRAAQGVAFSRLGAVRWRVGSKSWPGRYFIIKKDDWPAIAHLFMEAFDA